MFADEEVTPDAWMFEMTGGFAALTVIVVCAVAVPLALAAVSVYVVVAAGVTEVEPDTATDPTPESIVTLVAPAVFQLRVLLCPVTIAAGDAVKEEIVGAGLGDPDLNATRTLTVSLDDDSVPVEA